MFWQAEKGGLSAGTARKGGGVLGAGKTRKKGGLRCASGKKRGSLPRHIHILNIYVTEYPPPPGTGYAYVILLAEIETKRSKSCSGLIPGDR